jgi:hypothetical protein
MHTVLVLGADGVLGARIAAELAKTGASRMLVAGRDLEAARATARSLGLRARSALQLDAAGPGLAEAFGARGVNLVIHAAGPFRGQGHGVPAAAILAGANYIDLADHLAFIDGIRSLDAPARAARITLVSGASAMSALSAAVVDRYRPAFSRVEAVRAGLGPGEPSHVKMSVELEGLGGDGQPLTRRWQVLIERGHAALLACGPALVLARRLATGASLPKGVLPCPGLLTVEECLAPARSRAVTVTADPV